MALKTYPWNPIDGLTFESADIRKNFRPARRV